MINLDSQIDTAERFLAAWARALSGCPATPAPDAVQDVSVDAMPTGEHKAVFRALIVFAMTGLQLLPWRLRQVARQLGYVGTERILNPANADLIDRLPYVEMTAGGLAMYARAVNHCHRKCEQIKRIWRRVPMPDDTIQAPDLHVITSPTRPLGRIKVV